MDPPTYRCIQTPCTTYSNTAAPTQPCTTYSNTAVVCTAASSTCVGIYFRLVLLCRARIFIFDDFPPPLGASERSTEGRLNTPPARRVRHHRTFFRFGLRGLLCGAGVKPPRGRGRLSGAREAQLFFRVCYNQNISKIRLDITATEKHNTVRTVLTGVCS